MSKRLVKVASELNVGVNTIVDYLQSKGYEIVNRPTTKITDEMYSDLQEEFQNSLAVKEKADQLVIGTTKTEKKPLVGGKLKPLEPLAPISTKKETTEPAQEETTPPPVVEETPVAKQEPQKETTPEIKPVEKPKLKVLGKIDVDNIGKKKKKAEPKKEEEKPAEPKVEDAETKPEQDLAESKSDPATDVPTETKEKEKPAGPETIRAKTPKLEGLKVLGKIDTDKLESSKKRKKKTDTAKDSNKRQKRKRTRRKVVTPGSNQRDRPQRKKKPEKEEIKEVSQKEIEEKIKATMARITGGKKNKRQKIRRENRQEKRERQERIDSEQESSVIELSEFISVSEFASLLNVSVTEVITTCMNLGVIVSINQRLDAEIIELVADEFDKEIQFVSAEESIDEEEITDDPKDLKPRAPIVTVMGHVDHGKTSLLDFIREARVASGEAGGITQHIGAYQVNVGEGDSQKSITFLDTPGHEAFTAMRARGAKVTDVVVIIIAADDSIMPQTKEAISHAQAAGVPMVFAINKIDKPGANPDRIKTALADMNLLVEEWGGTYQSQDISAKTGQNVDDLLEKIILEAEMLELKANPDRLAVSTVVEASLDKGRGYVTKVLIETGTLSIGDSIAAGIHSGRVKAMFNDRNKKIKKAGPSMPVLILGLDGAPQAGESLKVYPSEQEAKDIAGKRAQIVREQSNRAAKRISLEEIGRRLALGSFKELNLIVKGDVDGSVEALSDSLIKLSQESVQVNVIHKAVGQIIESDVLLASASDAIIIGFQVRPSLNARKLAEKEGVEIKSYSIIYEAIDTIKKAIEGLLEPDKEEKIVAQLVVREVYKISKVGTIAGCFVEDGTITRDTKIRVIRDGIVIYPTKEGVTGTLDSLKRFKDDVKEVRKGFECGLSVTNFNDIKVGDTIEGYVIEEIAQTLD